MIDFTPHYVGTAVHTAACVENGPNPIYLCTGCSQS